MESGDAILVGVLFLATVLLVVIESVGSARGKFNSAFWRLPLDDKLDHIAPRRGEWWLMGIAWILILALLTAGMAGLASLLETSGEPTIAWVGFGVFLVGAVAWLGGLFVQTPVVWTAAAERHDTGSTPRWLQPFWLAGWVAELSFLVLVNLAYAAMGVAMISSGFPAVWTGWVALAVGVLTPVGVLITRAGFPHLALTAPIVFGVALLIEGL